MSHIDRGSLKLPSDFHYGQLRTDYTNTAPSSSPPPLDRCLRLWVTLLEVASTRYSVLTAYLRQYLFQIPSLRLFHA